MSEGTSKVSGKGQNKIITVKKGSKTVTYYKGDYCRFPGQAPDKYEIIKINNDSFIAKVVRDNGGYSDSMPLMALYPVGALKHVPKSEQKVSKKKSPKKKSPKKKSPKKKSVKKKRVKK